MSIISVRLNDEEEKVYKEFSELYGKSISTLLKESLDEKIENDFDLKAIQEYEENPDSDDYEEVSHEEVLKRYGLKHEI